MSDTNSDVDIENPLAEDGKSADYPDRSCTATEELGSDSGLDQGGGSGDQNDQSVDGSSEGTGFDPNPDDKSNEGTGFDPNPDEESNEGTGFDPNPDEESNERTNFDPNPDDESNEVTGFDPNPGEESNEGPDFDLNPDDGISEGDENHGSQEEGYENVGNDQSTVLISEEQESENGMEQTNEPVNEPIHADAADMELITDPDVLGDYNPNENIPTYRGEDEAESESSAENANEPVNEPVHADATDMELITDPDVLGDYNPNENIPIYYGEEEVPPESSTENANEAVNEPVHADAADMELITDPDVLGDYNPNENIPTYRGEDEAESESSTENASEPVNEPIHADAADMELITEFEDERDINEENVEITGEFERDVQENEIESEVVSSQEETEKKQEEYKKNHDNYSGRNEYEADYDNYGGRNEYEYVEYKNLKNELNRGGESYQINIANDKIEYECNTRFLDISKSEVLIRTDNFPDTTISFSNVKGNVSKEASVQNAESSEETKQTSESQKEEKAEKEEEKEDQEIDKGTIEKYRETTGGRPFYKGKPTINFQKWLEKEGKRKECGRCHNIKNKNEYRARMINGKKILFSQCNKCRNEINQIYQFNNKLKIIKNIYNGKLKGKCQTCNVGIERLPSLEFHHTNPNLKSKKGFSMYRNWETTKEQIEREKATILCSNCHTNQRSPYYKKHKEIINNNKLNPITSNKVIYSYVKKKLPNHDYDECRSVIRHIKKYNIIKYLYNGKCIGCREVNIQSNLPALQFHHREKKNPYKWSKTYCNLRNLESEEILSKLKNENCIVLCSNCHRMLESIQFEINFYEIIDEEYKEEIKEYYKQLIRNISEFKYI